MNPSDSLRSLVLAAACAVATLACSGKDSRAVDTDQNPKAAQINAQLGTEYLRKNMLEEARFKLERALEQDDSVALAHSSYALLMSRVGEISKARRHYRKAIRLNDRNPDTLNNFGLFLCDQGDIDDALEHFERAYSDPFYQTPEIALANAGICLTNEGRGKEGLELVNRAIDANPDYAYSYFQRAFVYFNAGDAKRAKSEIDQFHERFGYSLASLTLGIEIARKIRDRALAAEYLGVMGRKFSKSKEYRKAVEDLRTKPIR